jgi:hypothetical protein
MASAALRDSAAPDRHQRGRVKNDEPWSNGELYVTRFDGCKLVAARNLEFFPRSHLSK